MAELCYKHTWLENDLRRQIMANLLPENKPIWSENVLSEKYRLSRNTVRRAISALIEEGLLTRVPGSGTYVVPRVQRKHRRPVRKKPRIILQLTFPPYSERTYLSGSDSYFSDLQILLKKRGYEFQTEHIGNEDEVPEILRSGAVAGIIFEGNLPLDYFHRHIQPHPCIGLDSFLPEPICPVVMVGRYAMGERCVHHLYRNGHRRIGFLADECRTYESLEMFKGYRSAMLDLDLPVRPEWEIRWMREMIAGELNNESVCCPRDYTEYLKPVFDSPQPPTALVCFDNWRAVCTLVSLEKIGLKVPDDVSLIGSFRSREYPSYLLPRRITCFRMDTRQLWLEGLRLLFEIIDSPDCVSAKKIILNPAFVPGETVKKLLPDSVRPGLNNSPNE